MGRTATFVVLLTLTFWCSSTGHALDANRQSEHIIRTVSRLLKTINKGTTFAQAQIIIDRLVDPSIDGKATLERIDQMRGDIEQMAGPKASADKKLAALRSYLYDAGPWNAGLTYSYNLDDPLGAYLPSKLLANYLDTRKGNCVSMPFLFIAIADKMGLEVTASTAPHHVFVKYKTEAGETVNLETTSGALPARDTWIRKNMPMTDEAIENGVYMKTLSRQETLVVMAMVLVEHAMEEQRYGTVLNLINLLAPYYPNYAPLYLAQGSAAAKIIDIQFRSKYPRPRDIPPSSLGYYQHLVQLNQSAFTKAEGLGWVPEAPMQVR